MDHPLSTPDITQNPEIFRRICTDAFQHYCAEGQAISESAEPSHLCIRTKNHADYNILKDFGAQIGIIYNQQNSERDLAFIELDQSLTTSDGASLSWLEITAPKDDHPFTGPQMLVFADLTCPNPRKELSGDKSGFVLRIQQNTAEFLAKGP